MVSGSELDVVGTSALSAARALRDSSVVPGGFGRDYNRRRKAEGAMANAVGISETNVEKKASRQEGEGEGEGGKEEGKESVVG